MLRCIKVDKIYLYVGRMCVFLLGLRVYGRLLYCSFTMPIGLFGPCYSSRLLFGLLFRGAAGWVVAITQLRTPVHSNYGGGVGTGLWIRRLLATSKLKQ